MVKIGIIQHAPVYLNLTESMDKAINLITEAAASGVNIAFFGETWLSGYPAWLDYCPEVAMWNHEPTKEVYLRMVKNSIRVPGDETRCLGELARKMDLVICMGINEKVNSGPGNGTLFNSLIIINSSGEVAVHHRKLMPTFTEKLLYGPGDGYGLKTYQTQYGSIGGLICWEHWMPHARQALHNSGEQIHLAAWPGVHELHQLASRHYAFEGRCFVVASGLIMKASDIPGELKIPHDLKSDPDKYILKGGSCVIGPDGNYILDPVFNEERILVAEINIESAIKEKMTMDTSGHYYRPDIFSFSVNQERME